jgi:glycosyltransferase involved in cell wall biosynthesis
MSVTAEKRIRVLFVTTSFPRFPDDYAGSFVYRFALYLQKEFCDVTVVAPDDKESAESEEFNGILVRRFKYYFKKYQRVAYGNGGILANLRTSLHAVLQLPFFLIAMTFKTTKEIRNCDIVHCHWLPVVFPVFLAKKFTFSSAPIVLTNWGSDTRLLPLWLQRFALKLVNGCISTAQETDQHLLRLNYTNFITAPSPIDEDKFSRQLDEVSFKNELDIDPGATVISFIGRLNYFKDPLTFIHACELLKKKDFNFVALIAGGGDLENECREEIRKSDLQDTVKLLGFRKDTESLLGISDIAVHISPIENTWATVIAEAMYCDVPMVITDVGNTKSTFTHNMDCYMVPPNDPENLSSALEALINSASLRDIIISGGRNLLIKHGKIGNESARKTFDFYTRILKKDE